MDRERTVREVLRFFAIAFGATAVLHGAIAAFGLPFSLSLSSPVLLLYLLGLATPAAAAIGLSVSSSVGSFLRSALGPASLAVCGVALVAQGSLLAATALVAYATGDSDSPAGPWPASLRCSRSVRCGSCSARSSAGAGTRFLGSCGSSRRARPRC